MGVIHKISPDNGTTQYSIRDDSIAPVELSTTASQAYSVGDQFTLNDGKIYKATADIAQGDTITVDTNCEEAGTVSEQLNSKQPTLTFDNTPTKNSPNPVKSSGVFDAIDDVYGVMAENGARNRLNYKARRTSTSGTYFTQTVTADGGITVVGSRNEASNLDLFNVGGASQTLGLEGDYKFYGCPEGASANTFFMAIKDITDNNKEYFDYGNGVVIPMVANHSYSGRIYVAANQVMNHTFYPQFVLASDTYEGHTDYAMTNAELTLKSVYNQDNIAAFKQGNLAIVEFSGATPKNIADLNFATIGLKPAFYASTFQCRCDRKPVLIEIGTDGIIVSVTSYANYGADPVDLKSDTTKQVYGIITYVIRITANPARLLTMRTMRGVSVV